MLPADLGLEPVAMHWMDHYHNHNHASEVDHTGAPEGNNKQHRAPGISLRSWSAEAAMRTSLATYTTHQHSRTTNTFGQSLLGGIQCKSNTAVTDQIYVCTGQQLTTYACAGNKQALTMTTVGGRMLFPTVTLRPSPVVTL